MHLTSALNCLEKNTQTLLIVIIALELLNISLGNFNAALYSKQHTLDIHLKLFGEEHADTANSYHSLGITQHLLRDFNAALDSEQHALDIHLKLFGEEHADTAYSYHNLGATQHSLGNFNAR